MREKEYLAALRVIDGIIGLEALHCSDEIGSRNEIRRADEGVKLDRRELDLARQLIESLTGTFEPEPLKNEYLARVRELIEAKAKGQKIAAGAPAAARRPQIIDITEALKRSLREREGPPARRRVRVSARPKSSSVFLARPGRER